MGNKKKLKGTKNRHEFTVRTLRNWFYQNTSRVFEKSQLQPMYDIRANDCIHNRLRKYGNFNYPKYDSIGLTMKNPNKQQIKELEAQLYRKRKSLAS